MSKKPLKTNILDQTEFYDVTLESVILALFNENVSICATTIKKNVL